MSGGVSRLAVWLIRRKDGLCFRVPGEWVPEKDASVYSSVEYARADRDTVAPDATVTRRW